MGGEKFGPKEGVELKRKEQKEKKNNSASEKGYGGGRGADAVGSLKQP